MIGYASTIFLTCRIIDQLIQVNRNIIILLNYLKIFHFFTEYRFTSSKNNIFHHFNQYFKIIHLRFRDFLRIYHYLKPKLKLITIFLNIDCFVYFQKD